MEPVWAQQDRERRRKRLGVGDRLGASQRNASVYPFADRALPSEVHPLPACGLNEIESTCACSTYRKEDSLQLPGTPATPEKQEHTAEIEEWPD